MPRVERPMPAPLPREGLGAALWLLPPVLALLPHLQTLPLWVGLACLGAWTWRLALEMAGKPLPPRSLRVLLALAGLAGVFWQFGSIVGQQAGVPLFLLLLFLKLLETSSQAEKRLLLILTQFAAMGYFLMSQSLPVTAYLLGISVLSVAAMASLQAGGGLALGRALTRSVALFAGGLPLALMLFVFFPRLDHPLWHLPTQGAGGGTGLSDTMRPGDISHLIQSGEIALRARFNGPAPAVKGLYWRGPVLDEFDGRVWRAIPGGIPFRGEARGQGQPLQMTLTVEPHQRRWLFSPGLPDPLPEETSLAAGLQWQARDPVTRRDRWSVTVFPKYRHWDPSVDLARALILPEGFNPRARALARAWRQADSRPRALVRRALDLYTASFRYTLRPPLLGMNSVDDFLFSTKQGFCEHFAGSFVFLMRAAGVPARVVTGYLGGEPNPLDGHVVVRQSDAHAWAEVWMGPTEGWVRVDPTASVSPLRVEQGIGAALPATELPPALARLSLPWLQALRHAWEMLDNGWNQWVLGYGQAQQLALLARFAPSLADIRWLAPATVLAGMIGLGLLAWFYRRGPKGRAGDPAARAWREVERRLGRLGLGPRVGEGPRHYMDRIAAARPDLAAKMEKIGGLYLAVRYDGRSDALGLLKREAARFRPFREPRPDRHDGKPVR